MTTSFAPRHRIRSTLLCAALLAGSLFSGLTASAQRLGTALGDAASGHYHLGYTWSDRAALSDGHDRGDLGLQQIRLGATTRASLDDRSGLSLGLDFTWLRLDATADQGLPSHLHGHAASVDFDYRLSAAWQLRLLARPGVYADTTTVNGDTFNAPVVALAHYTVDRNLAWQFGFRWDDFSDYAFVPLIGVRWQFAPRWTLNLGFPRAGVFWRLQPNLTCDWHVSMLGGNYRITRDYRPAGAPFVRSTRDTYLDVRELRTGLGVDWKWPGDLSLRAEVGWALDRKFEYFNRGINLDGDGAAYATLALQGRF